MKKYKETIEIPNEIFEHILYDETSPSGLIWALPKKKRKLLGIAGNKNKVNGYWLIGFCSKIYRCHRVIYKMFNKINIQHTEIDHWDQDKDNNTIENLRIATSNQQQWNKGIRSNNTSGIKGVCWDKRNNKWKAQIKKNGKSYNLGHFDDKYEAGRVVKKKRDELHGEFACNGETNIIPKPKTESKLTIFDI